MDQKDDKDLTEQLERLNSNFQKALRQHSLRYSFVRGVVQGLGSALGATLVIGVIIYLLSQISFIPIVGTFIEKILRFLNQNRK